MADRLGRLHWTLADFGLSPERSVRITRWVHDRSVPRHDHDFWELVLVMGGHAVQETDAGSTPLSARCCVLVRPGAFHDFVECEGFDIINCLILPSVFDNELAWLQEDRRIARVLRPHAEPLRPTAPRTIQFSAGRFERCGVELEPLATRFREPPKGHKPAHVGALLVVLDVLAAAWEEQYGEAVEVPDVVRRAARSLEADMARNWRMVDLGDQCHISPEHLSRQFTAALGMPPMAYLARLRLERAAAMLRRTSLPAAEVGRRVGYNRPGHFNRRFKAYFHTTPGAYQIRHRGVV